MNHFRPLKRMPLSGRGSTFDSRGGAAGYGVSCLKGSSDFGVSHKMQLSLTLGEEKGLIYGK